MTRRKFKTLDNYLAYLKAVDEENKAILKAMQRRPLRKGDRIDRTTITVEGKAFWRSQVARHDGGFEIWLKQYLDHDESHRLTTHERWTLISTLETKGENND